jgi:hypothetical protein
MTKSKNGKISEPNHYFSCPAIEPWEEIVLWPDLRVVDFLAGFGNLTI